MTEDERKITNTVVAKTPTEILLQALEFFGTDEPKRVLIIWETETNLYHNFSGSRLGTIGLLEVGKAAIIEGRYATLEE